MTQLDAFRPRARRTDPNTSHAAAASMLEGGEEHPLRARSRLPIQACDCCGGKTKLYRRKLNSGQARVLIALYHAVDWVHLGRTIPALVAEVQGDTSKLTHWGLAEARPSESDSTKRDSGIWRITADGRAFVLRTHEVPSHAYVASPGDRLLGMESTTVDIVEALGEGFNYHELMRGA